MKDFPARLWFWLLRLLQFVYHTIILLYLYGIFFFFFLETDIINNYTCMVFFLWGLVFLII